MDMWTRKASMKPQTERDGWKLVSSLCSSLYCYKYHSKGERTFLCSCYTTNKVDILL